MRTLEGFIEVKLNASCDNFYLKFEILFEDFFQGEDFRNAFGENEHIDTAGILKLGVREELVQDNISDSIFAEADDDAHAVTAGFVADESCAVNALVLD